MIRLACSAPGKLFISGEYAVLNGAPSIVTAVSTRATASVPRRPRDPSPVLKSVEEHVIEYLKKTGRDNPALPNIAVDSPDFQVGRHKIGVGSSSATTAAACGFYFEWSGLDIAAHRDDIMDLAIRAHRAAQGGKGSGADVAAAIHGGTLVFSQGTLQEKISISCVELVPVWSGRAASTTKLIESTERLKRAHPAAYSRCFAELTRIAEQMVTACRACDAQAIIAATRDYGAMMGELGEQAKAPIVTSQHALIAELARGAGGAAKPSGAGGGDVAIGLFANSSQSAAFRVAVTKAGFDVLDISPDAKGLRRESI